MIRVAGQKLTGEIVSLKLQLNYGAIVTEAIFGTWNRRSEYTSYSICSLLWLLKAHHWASKVRVWRTPSCKGWIDTVHDSLRLLVVALT